VRRATAVRLKAHRLGGPLKLERLAALRAAAPPNLKRRRLAVAARIGLGAKRVILLAFIEDGLSVEPLFKGGYVMACLLQIVIKGCIFRGASQPASYTLGSPCRAYGGGFLFEGHGSRRSPFDVTTRRAARNAAL
jgi:hypothetical protein